MPGTTSTALPSFSHDQHHETDAAKRKGVCRIEIKEKLHSSCNHHINEILRINLRCTPQVHMLEKKLNKWIFKCIANCIAVMIKHYRANEANRCIRKKQDNNAICYILPIALSLACIINVCSCINRRNCLALHNPNKLTLKTRYTLLHALCVILTFCLNSEHLNHRSLTASPF